MTVVPGVGNWHSLFAWGWEIDIFEIKNPQIPGGGVVTGRIEPYINGLMSQVNSDRRDYPEVATYMGVKYIVGF